MLIGVKMVKSELNKLIWSAKDDVIDGNEKQFDDVADASHNGESDSTWSGDFFEFWVKKELHVMSGFSQTSRNLLLYP